MNNMSDVIIDNYMKPFNARLILTVSQNLRVMLRKFIAWVQPGNCKIVKLNNVTTSDYNNMNRLQETAVFSHFPSSFFCLLHFTRIDRLEVSRVQV